MKIWNKIKRWKLYEKLKNNIIEEKKIKLKEMIIYNIDKKIWNKIKRYIK